MVARFFVIAYSLIQLYAPVTEEIWGNVTLIVSVHSINIAYQEGVVKLGREAK
jgi:hypothetical protein